MDIDTCFVVMDKIRIETLQQTQAGMCPLRTPPWAEAAQLFDPLANPAVFDFATAQPKAVLDLL